MGYTNSPLVNYTKISPNKTINRNHKIDTLTIHCYVGQASVESAGSWFSKPTTQASCNYMIGSDGRIGLIVDEKDRSWCSSSSANDNRAITIECACDKTHPYAVNDKVYNSLINLVADICKRNGIKRLVWSTNKTDRINHNNGCNMTVHRDYKNKACPGEYLYNLHGEIAEKVNAKLGVITTSITSNSTTKVPFLIKVDKVEKGDVLNIRKEPNADATKTGQLAYNDPNTYTIIEVKNGWGLLKSKLGWINLSYTKVVSGNTSTTNTVSKPVVTTPTKTLDDWAKEVMSGKHGSGHANRETSLKRSGCTYAYEQVRTRVNELSGVKTTPSMPQKSLDDWAREVKAGKHGKGHSNREKSLKKAGCQYSYSQVRARVNALS